MHFRAGKVRARSRTTQREHSRRHALQSPHRDPDEPQRAALYACCTCWLVRRADLRCFAAIFQSFSRITKAKSCLLRITPSKLFILMPLDEQSVRVWTEVTPVCCKCSRLDVCVIRNVLCAALQESIFTEYVVQSQHENNEILLQLNVEHIISALKSGGLRSLCSRFIY